MKKLIDPGVLLVLLFLGVTFFGNIEKKPKPKRETVDYKDVDINDLPRVPISYGPGLTPSKKVEPGKPIDTNMDSLSRTYDKSDPSFDMYNNLFSNDDYDGYYNDH